LSRPGVLAPSVRDDCGVTAWPAWATESVELRSPDATWQERGERERRLLETRLRPWLVAAVEHVGSTAVPGLAAKPILDLQAAVADLECATDVAAALAADGWYYVDPNIDGRPWRRLFVKVAAGRRAAHLHVMAPDTPRWGEQLAFRDALRADPELAQAYAALKRTLARRHADDREAYTAAKTAFVHAALGRGRA
jgi:GrpB-like predicted nucleotidyltransferase (UPF0157 family)